MGLFSSVKLWLELDESNPGGIQLRTNPNPH